MNKYFWQGEQVPEGVAFNAFFDEQESSGIEPEQILQYWTDCNRSESARDYLLGINIEIVQD